MKTKQRYIDSLLWSAGHDYYQADAIEAIGGSHAAAESFRESARIYEAEADRLASELAAAAAQAAAAPATAPAPAPAPAPVI